MLLNLSLFLGTFLLMEAAAWFTHKYIMHGILWKWHKSHHIPHNNTLEKNDLFAVIFSLPAIVFIIVGAEVEKLAFLFWMGLGISLYGLCYVIFHDIIVHRRIKVRFIAKSVYMKRIIRAHKIHHTYLTQKGAKAFGFLYAPKKYAQTKDKN